MKHFPACDKKHNLKAPGVCNAKISHDGDSPDYDPEDDNLREKMLQTGLRAIGLALAKPRKDTK